MQWAFGWRNPSRCHRRAGRMLRLTPRRSHPTRVKRAAGLLIQPLLPRLSSKKLLRLSSGWRERRSNPPKSSLILRQQCLSAGNRRRGPALGRPERHPGSRSPNRPRHEGREADPVSRGKVFRSRLRCNGPLSVARRSGGRFEQVAPWHSAPRPEGRIRDRERHGGRRKVVTTRLHEISGGTGRRSGVPGDH